MRHYAAIVLVRARVCAQPKSDPLHLYRKLLKENKEVQLLFKFKHE